MFQSLLQLYSNFALFEEISGREYQLVQSSCMLLFDTLQYMMLLELKCQSLLFMLSELWARFQNYKFCLSSFFQISTPTQDYTANTNTIF